MAKAAPGHISDVQKTVHTSQVDEGTEIREVLDRTRNGIADFDTFEEFLPLLAALLLNQFAPAQDNVFPVVVNLDDLEVVGIADKLLEVARRNDVDLRSWEESLDADVHHQPTLNHRFHLALDQSVAGKNLGDLVPVLTIGGFLLREHNHAFVILEALEEHLHFVAYFERLNVVELRRRDYALGLVTDIHKDLPRPNLQNAPLHDAAFFEVAHRLRHQILHLQHKRWALLMRRGSVVKNRGDHRHLFPRKGEGN